MFRKKECKIPPHRESLRLYRNGETPDYLELLGIPYIKENYKVDLSINAGIVDNGIWPHKDLEGDVLFRFNFTNESGEGNHGTHCAGWTGGDKTGVSNSASLLSLKALRIDGGGSYDDVANAIYKAIELDLDYINLSLGGGFNRRIRNALNEFTALGPQKLVFVATGNDKGKTLFPAEMAATNPQIIAVGAGHLRGKNDAVLAPFSNTGITTCIGQGVDVYSTIGENKYAYYDGTSMAAPYVLGVTLYMRSVFPDLNYMDWHFIISRSSLDMDCKGQDDNTGFGFVHALQAIKYTELMAAGEIRRGTQDDLFKYNVKKNILHLFLAFIGL